MVRRKQSINAAIVELSQDAIIGHTMDGVIISWNAGARRVFGYEACEIAGQSLTKLTPANDGEEWRGALGRVHFGSEPIR